ncbi:MAG: UPF0755 protein [Myxococcota bacterium]|jgi:UPF0755 protein
MLLLTMLTGCQMIADNAGAPADSNDDTDYTFTVQPGSTPRGLGPKLAEAGIIDDGDAFTTYVRITKEGGCLKAGRFRLRRSMSAEEILEVVCGVPLANDEPFTVVEGWRIREIDAALTAKGWIEAGEYATLAAKPEDFTATFPLPDDTLEGYLYPETYMVDAEKFTAEGFIQRQLDTLTERFYTENADAITASSRDWSDLLIMASMIEREEPTPANRPLIAGILWKRIDSNWFLGVDATSRYTLDEWNDRRAFLGKLRDPDDPYNTRLRYGLPPTPIGNPGQVALEASLKPEESEFWYYLHDSKQVLHPSRNQAEHEAYRKKYNVY